MIEIFKIRLKELRNKNDFTHEELADKLGMRRSTVTKYESGEREPDFVTLSKIAISLDTSTDYLLGLTNDPRPTNKINISNRLINNKDSLDIDGIQLFPAAGTQDDKERELKQDIKDYLKEQLKDAILEMREEKRRKNK